MEKVLGAENLAHKKWIKVAEG